MFIIPFANISVWLSFFIFADTVFLPFIFYAELNHIDTTWMCACDSSGCLSWYQMKLSRVFTSTMFDDHWPYVFVYTLFVFCTRYDMYVMVQMYVWTDNIDRIYIIDFAWASIHNFFPRSLACNHIIDELHVVLIVDDTFGIIEKNCKCFKRIFNHLTCIEHVTNYNYLQLDGVQMLDIGVEKGEKRMKKKKNRI